MEKQGTDRNITLQNISLLNNNIMGATIDDMARDMKFYAVFYIVMGALSCLSIIGAVYGIPLIIYSIKLKDSAEQFRSFSSSKDFFQLQQALENQRKFFFFNKVVILIGITLFIFYILIIIWFGASLLSSLPTGQMAAIF